MPHGATRRLSRFALVPKAFVSHSTADQARFVRGLAERLQSNGIETWYAEWALLDGDSLTEKIFEHGIGEADIFIVVLSNNTRDSKWVKAELAVGLVRQIETKTRLIPIVLDGVDVPVALQATLQRRISDPARYDAEFDALLRSIYNKPTTPPLGPAPSYTGAPTVRGLTPSDAVVYVALATIAIETNSLLVAGKRLHERCAEEGVSESAVVEGMHVLDQRALIKEARQFGSRIQHVLLRPRFLREYVGLTADIHALEQRLIAGIVNALERVEVGQLAVDIGVQPVVAHAVLDRFDRRLFTLRPVFGGQIFVQQVSPLLARELDS